MVVAEICIVEYTMTTVAHVRIHKNVKYHQNQISSHNQLETEQTREALPQKKFTHSQMCSCKEVSGYITS